MPSFKAKKDGNWVGGSDQSQGTTVYGKLGGSWLYAKSVWAKRNGVWERAWTDCRKYDEAGGRDWSAPSTVVTTSGTCGNKTQTTTVTRTKDGCPSDVRATTVSAPDCGAGCYSTPTVTEEYYDGSCGTRRYRTKTVTNPVAGSNCPSTTTYSEPYASPTCEGSCTVAQTATFVEGGVEYYYTGPAGYYEAFLDGDGPAGGCADCPSGYFNYGYYYITVCNGVRTIQVLSCDGCRLY